MTLCPQPMTLALECLWLLDGDQHLHPSPGVCCCKMPTRAANTAYKVRTSRHADKGIRQMIARHTVGEVDASTNTLNAQCYKLDVGSPAQRLGITTLRCQGTCS